MFRQPGGGRRRISEVIAKFREKGATSPEKAMTAQELGLPPRFEEAMKGRLGATGIFVEVGGRYYLDEARLQQVEQQQGTSRMMRGPQAGTTRSKLFALRTARMAAVVAALVLVVVNILFVQSALLGLLVIVLIVLWMVLTVLQFYYVSRLKNKEYASGFNETP